jgi:integrase
MDTTSTAADARRYEATGAESIRRLVTTESARDGLLFFFKKYKGKTYKRALNTKNLSEARSKAKLLAADIEAGRWHELEDRKLRTNWASVPEVCARYLEVATIKSAKLNVWSLRYVLRTAARNPDACSTRELTRQLVADFQLARRKATAGNPLREARAAHGMNSILRQARCVFAAEARQHFGQLLLPDLEGFMKAPFADEPRVQYFDPPAAVLRRIGENYPALRQSDPGAFAAFLLGAFVGLRNGEAAAARWEWIETAGDGMPRLRLATQADWRTKTGRERMVSIEPVVLTALRSVRGARGWDGYAGEPDFLIPAGHATERGKRMFVRLNAWLRAQGLDREHFSKGFYMLRKHFGRVTAWREGGSYYAARALGNDPKIAAQYYDSASNTAPIEIPLPEVAAVVPMEVAS